MTEYTYSTISPGLVSLATNARTLTWQWGWPGAASTREDHEASPIRLRYTVDPDLEPLRGPGLVEHNYYRGALDGDEIGYHRALPLGRALTFRLSGLLSEEPHLVVNPDYARFVKYRFMNLHSAGYILSDVLTYSLLSSGLAPLYCSSFTHPGAGTSVLMAPSRTGKTVTVDRACREFGAGFLAEDMAITDGTTIHPVPFTTSHRRPRFTRGSRYDARTPDPADRVHAEPSAITHLVLLERNGEPGVRGLDRTSALHKVEVLNHGSLHYSLSPTLLAASYLNPAVDLPGCTRTESRLLGSLLDSASGLWAIGALSPEDFVHLLPGLLGTREHEA